MDNSWLTVPDLTEKLNAYYLDNHQSATIEFPSIPRPTTDIPQVTALEVYHHLSSINTQKASNTEDYPSWISRNNAHLLSDPIADIINCILRDGCFPSMWKKAEVVPLNKVKSPQTFKELRPISLLFHLGKISERIISNHIKKDLPNMHNQYAYTAKIGTTDALAKFSADIATNLDNTDTIAVQALLLDFSKAFDRMRPDLAIEKLLSLNVNPILVQVVQSFFEDRQQRIKYRRHLSDYYPCRIGVPQGTIMGPILWNIFVHDLVPAIGHIKYADDTTIYNIVDKQGVNISESTARKATISFTENPLQHAAQYASDWCMDNSMILNTAKSITITFSLQKEISSPAIEIHGATISHHNTVKLLGVLYDSHLKFSDHVDWTIEKTRSAVHAITKLKKAGVRAPSLTLFYKARILSILTYAAPSWFPFIGKNDREKLENHQKMCLRLILPYSEHYEDRLHDLNMSELTVYMDLICLRYVEKVRQHQSHPLSEHIPKPTTGKYHRQLARPKHRTSLLGRSLFYKYF